MTRLVGFDGFPGHFTGPPDNIFSPTVFTFAQQHLLSPLLIHHVSLRGNLNSSSPLVGLAVDSLALQEVSRSIRPTIYNHPPSYP